MAAYVRGAGAEDLQTLDVQRATDAAWRRVFTEGRVDQALEAAARLKTLRAETDEGMQALAREVTAVGRLIDGVGEDRRRAAGRVAAALSASADAEAAAQREAQARRAAEAAASATAPPRAPTTPGSRPEAPPSPPPSFPKPSVSLAEAWAELRDCEAGGDYTAVGPDGQYRGAYQFDRSTWASVGGHGDPAAAPPAEQDYRAQLLYDLVGKGAWPYCGRLLP